MRKYSPINSIDYFLFDLRFFPCIEQAQFSIYLYSTAGITQKCIKKECQTKGYRVFLDGLIKLVFENSVFI